jgi:hypothetical protein
MPEHVTNGVSAVAPATQSAPTFVLAMECGPRNVMLESYDSRAAAETAAGLLWCSWIVYRRADPVLFHAEGYHLEEVSKGGVGFGHRSIRRIAPEMHAAEQRERARRNSKATAQQGGGGDGVSTPLANGHGEVQVRPPAVHDVGAQPQEVD